MGAKKAFDDWVAAEKVIDNERKEVIEMLQKKIAEIQGQRMASRSQIIEGEKLLNHHLKQKQ